MKNEKRADHDTPTPRASGLWQQWRDAATMLDERLRAWALPRSRVGPLLDVTAARTAFSYATKARALVNEFADWPFHPPEDARRVRAIQDLIDLQSAGEKLMAGIS